MSQQIGFAAEEMAKKFLMKQGLKPVTSNYRTTLGEIDLVMRDKNCLVFIEVKARKTNAFGSALACVHFAKQKKIIKTALCYLQANKFKHNYPFRFDVVTLEGCQHQVSWIKNAFGADS